MTAPELLSRLDGVRPRGTGQWVALCPAHDDQSPSLAIKETDDRILLHCFAGCATASICEAVGFSMKNLFGGSAINPRDVGRHKSQREQEQRRDAAGATLDACKAAQRFIESRQCLDIAQWSNEELDAELNALAVANGLLESEGL